MQALFLPVVALAFAVSPVVGQNFGGRRAERVRQTVYSAIIIASLMMLVLALIAHFLPGPMIRFFSGDPHVIDFGTDYMKIVAFNFVASGIVFTSSSIFQGLGNTWPPLLSSFTRLFLFILPAAILARAPGFEIKHVWYLSVGSQCLQAIINLLLLRRELRRKLNFEMLEHLTPGGATAT
jgi:Na+-driven multidrug efflux pump